MTSATTTQTLNGIEMTIDIEHAYYRGDSEWSMDATDSYGNKYTIYVEGEYADQMDDSDFDWYNAEFESK